MNNRIQPRALRLGFPFFLNVFIVGAFFSSISAIFLGISDIDRGVPAFPPIGFLECAWGAYGVYVVTVLWCQRYNAPDHAVWFLRISIPLNILSLLSRNMTDAGVLGTFIIVSVIPPILWLIYFERSTNISKFYPSAPNR